MNRKLLNDVRKVMSRRIFRLQSRKTVCYKKSFRPNIKYHRKHKNHSSGQNKSLSGIFSCPRKRIHNKNNENA